MSSTSRQKVDRESFSRKKSLNRQGLGLIAAGLIIGAGLAVFLYFGMNFNSAETVDDEPAEGVNLPLSPVLGEAAPDFELLRLNGETMRLSEKRGKIVVLNFWATWCEPCKFEMPFFERIQDLDNSDLEIWGVNFDEPREKVQRFVKAYDLSFPILLDPGGEIQALYRVRGYPTTYIVDREGKIRFHHIGLISEDQLLGYLDQMGVN
jgi:peroxiredoxin